MKRLLLATSALTMLLIASPALALSDDCKTVLSLPPVSPYVKAVLSRADAGIAYADTANTGDFLGATAGDWMTRVAADFAALINANLDVNTQQNDLTENSACLNFDTVAISCEIDKVRDSFYAKTNTRALGAMGRLESLLTFLDNRLAQLRKGALDSSYRDNDWDNVFAFDPPTNVYCAVNPGDTCMLLPETECDTQNGTSFRTQDACIAWGGIRGEAAKSIPAGTPMCPYDSDYGPPVDNGYGCDTGALLPLVKFAPVKAEYDALATINSQINRFRANEKYLLYTEQSINTLYGSYQNIAQPQPQKHVSATGCEWKGGRCQNDPQTRCAKDTDCPDKGMCGLPNSTCKQKPNIICFQDSQCVFDGTDVGPCTAGGSVWTGGYCSTDQKVKCTRAGDCPLEGKCYDFVSLCTKNANATCSSQNDCRIGDTNLGSCSISTDFSWTGGLCENDPKTKCTQDSDCGKGNTCTYPQSVCKENRNIICFSDSECKRGSTDLGPCIPDDGKQRSNIELTGPFSIGKNEMELTNAFLSKRLQDAASRTFSTNLTFANEVSSLQETGSTIPDNNMFIRMVGGSSRLLNVAWSLMQGRDEASIFPAVTDPQVEIANTLLPLRHAVSSLATIASLKGGLRTFITNYAYFLRRSCVYRPCNASLEEVMRIAFTDSCFPYTNGQYLNDTPGNPRWQQCVSDAGLTLP